MSQTLVLIIKIAAVNSISYFRVSTVILLSHGYLPQVVKVNLETSHGSGELQDKKFILVIV